MFYIVSPIIDNPPAQAPPANPKMGVRPDLKQIQVLLRTVNLLCTLQKTPHANRGGHLMSHGQFKKALHASLSFNCLGLPSLIFDLILVISV